MSEFTTSRTVEYGTMFTGQGPDGETTPFVEPHSGPTSAEGRAQMYRRKGDPEAKAVQRTVTVTWGPWEPITHETREIKP